MSDTSISLHQWAANASADYFAQRNGAPIPVILTSRPGEGKSSIVETIVINNLDKALAARDLPTNTTPDTERPQGHHIHWSDHGRVAVLTDMPAGRDAPDYRGFLIPMKDGTSKYTKPDLICDVENLYAAGAQAVILFLDEIGQAEPLVQKSLADLLLNLRLGCHSLDRRTWIIGATNRVNDHAGVSRMLSINRNRVNTIEVHMEVQHWAPWAERRALPPIGIALARSFPGKIAVDAPPKDGPFPSWRSFTDALIWLDAYKSHLGMTDAMAVPFGLDGYAEAKVAGFIGEGLTHEFAAFARLVGELPKLDEILSNPLHCRVPSSTRLDAQYACAQMLVHYCNLKTSGALWTYAERLIPELTVSIAQGMLAKAGGTLMGDKAFQVWLTNPDNAARVHASV